MHTFTFEQGLLVVAILLLFSVLASKASAKLGIPALILFLLIGMLAGSDGPGGIAFDDIELAKSVGSLALAFILFAGGLDTDWPAVRPLLWRGISLATLGIVITAGLVGTFAHYVLGFSAIEGLLLGAIVSSTDAAAVFGVLRARKVRLKRRLVPLLELESGSNDPMAVFLTMGFTAALINPGFELTRLIPMFVQQMAIGGLVGYLGAAGVIWLINHLRLEYDGLYPAVTLSLVLFVFSGADAAGGNGFLSAYVAGLVLARSNFLHKISLIQFHDGLAWLMQIAMFLMFGLLVFPKNLVPIAGAGLIFALFLVVVARPAAVFVSLALARKMRTGEKLFVSWVGLRGATPIILSTFPLLAGVPRAETMFNIVFFVVLVSVLVQGTTLVPMARILDVIAPEKDEPMEVRAPGHAELLEVEVKPASPAVGKQVVELGLPRTALLVLLRRGEESYIPRGSTVIEPGDVMVIATRKKDWYELITMFEG